VEAGALFVCQRLVRRPAGCDERTFGHSDGPRPKPRARKTDGVDRVTLPASPCPARPITSRSPSPAGSAPR
jgi:hypothetical protein